MHCKATIRAARARQQPAEQYMRRVRYPRFLSVQSVFIPFKSSVAQSEGGTRVATASGHGTGILRGLLLKKTVFNLGIQRVGTRRYEYR
jgi:hypothetical protein